MAFAGLNVTFGFMITNTHTQGVSPIYGPITGSHNMTVAGTSNVAAATPPNSPIQAPMYSVYAAADSWITVGPTPTDPSVDGVRRFVQATVPLDGLCNPGDKVRWVAA